MENGSNAENRTGFNENWEKFKTGTVRFVDRRKHTKSENIRLIVAIATIVFIIGVFLPLLGGTLKFSMIDSSKSKETSETVIFEPQNDVINFSSGDLIFHQPLREFELFGTELGDMQVMGLNLYDTLTTPMPDYSGITEAKDQLQTGPITLLTNDMFVDFCEENLGDFGETVVEIGAVVNKIADSLGDALGQIERVLDKVKIASDEVRADIQEAEDTVSTIETIIAFAFAIIIILMMLVIFRKNKSYVIPGILTFFSAVFIAVEVAVIIINAEIHEAITSGMNNLSESIADMLNGFLPGLSDMLLQLTSAESISFLFKGTFYCGSGWWLSTIGLVAITVLSYILVRLERKTAGEELVETALAETELIEAEAE